MTINSEAILSVLAANETTGSDGKTSYYNLAIMQGGEVGNLSCTEDVYTIVKPTLIPLKPYKLTITNKVGGKYESCRITDVALLPDIVEDVANKQDNEADSKPDSKQDNKADNKPDSKQDNKANK